MDSGDSTTGCIAHSDNPNPNPNPHMRYNTLLLPFPSSNDGVQAGMGAYAYDAYARSRDDFRWWLNALGGLED